MARIAIFEIVMFLFTFNLVCNVIFAMNIFGSLYPGQVWNQSLGSFELKTSDPSPSIFGNTNTFNDTYSQYTQNNQSGMMDFGSLLNPIALVSQLQYLWGFLIATLNNAFLSQVLRMFIGEQLAMLLSTIFNVALLIVFVKVVSGRLIWE
jgi:hypothetical protein